MISMTVHVRQKVYFKQFKRKVFTRDPKCRFHTSSYGLQVPIISMMCRVGPITLSKGTGFPFFPKSHSFYSIYTYFYPYFSSFCTMYPNFGSFMLRASLLTPNFCFFFIFRTACGTPVVLQSLRGSSFGTQLPPKIGSLARTFLLAPSLMF